MTKRLPDELRVGPLRTADEARKWIKALHDADLMFHFDDDPAEIISIETDQRIFHDDDLVLIRARVAELFDFDFCPFEYTLALMGHNMEN